MGAKKIVILLLIFILIVGISITGFFIYKSQAPSTPKSTPTACPENEDRFYDFKEVKFGADILRTLREGFSFIKNFIRTRLYKEHFALSTGIITLDDIRAGRARLDPTKQYYRGIRNTTSTITPQTNGGRGCVEYPDVVFKEVPPATVINGTSGWKYVKDIDVLSAVKLNSSGDIICASSNGTSCLVKSETDLLNDINNPSYNPITTSTCNKFQYTQGSFTENNTVVPAHPCNKLIPTLIPNGPNYNASVSYKNNVLINQGPCASFTDSSDKVSLDCFKHIWTNLAGCPNYRDDFVNYYYNLSQNNGVTKGSRLRDAQAWASLPTETHRNACYGTDKTKWPTSQ
jgi:hypothetical protein